MVPSWLDLLDVFQPSPTESLLPLQPSARPGARSLYRVYFRQIRATALFATPSSPAIEGFFGFSSSPSRCTLPSSSSPADGWFLTPGLALDPREFFVVFFRLLRPRPP